MDPKTTAAAPRASRRARRASRTTLRPPGSLPARARRARRVIPVVDAPAPSLQVWNNGTRARVVLVVDVWHAALDDAARERAVHGIARAQNRSALDALEIYRAMRDRGSVPWPAPTRGDALC